MRADTYDFNRMMKRALACGRADEVSKLVYQWVKEDAISPDQMFRLIATHLNSEDK